MLWQIENIHNEINSAQSCLSGNTHFAFSACLNHDFAPSSHLNRMIHMKYIIKILRPLLGEQNFSVATMSYLQLLNAIFSEYLAAMNISFQFAKPNKCHSIRVTEFFEENRSVGETFLFFSKIKTNFRLSFKTYLLCDESKLYSECYFW